ncbi:metal-dependent hydrolase [Halonotius roseus]|uniref:Metal-dependent hydrolase n=1 Tax=Halonotius roseus TaxID=2511997 RepID=A0A544QRV3_9EURY|nr:metal-dependent hydrolase [Halonotius roseus]TQQ82142.1 metal-dependent hydrolase [Halonotius roseus]
MNKRGHVLNAVLLSIGLGYVLEPSATIETARMMVELLLPVTLGALFPDVDTAFGKHRKTLHNLLVLGIFAAWPIYMGNLNYVWIGITTHYILDVVGSTRGIALFYPLSSTEYNLPVGIPVSSSKSDLVTVLVTILEVGAFAGVLFYVVPEVTTYTAEMGLSIPL